MNKESGDCQTRSSKEVPTIAFPQDHELPLFGHELSVTSQSSSLKRIMATLHLVCSQAIKSNLRPCVAGSDIEHSIIEATSLHLVSIDLEIVAWFRTIHGPGPESYSDLCGFGNFTPVYRLPVKAKRSAVSNFHQGPRRCWI